MSKKHKQQRGAPASAADLSARIERARQEERFQIALELAKQLHKLEPTPAHDALLRQISLGRARQLREQGSPRDAAAMLERLLVLPGNEPAWLEQAAVELAACGEAQRALALLDRLPPSPAHAAVLEAAADAALRQPRTGRATLPESLQAGFDLVVQAFQQLAAGQDEAVKQSLQGIGLQSPFLEWKLLLRGLQAYYLNDDARALENWSRLRADRLPARLAAPLRLAIDPAFRDAQPPETQAALRRQADRLQSGAPIAALRALQAPLSAGEMAQALRLAENVAPALRDAAPALLGRLARCFQWAICEFGDEPDLRWYKRIFGAPPDDPALDRLAALALEHQGLLPLAHDAWQRYEQAVAAHPTAWPPGQAERVRALIWARMGDNASDEPDEAALAALPPFLHHHPDRPAKLTPDAAQCYQRSLKLAPDQRETHQALMQHYVAQNQDAKAEQAGRALLERYPDDLEALRGLADLRSGQADFAEAVQLLQRAARVNPLDREIRADLAAAQGQLGRSHAEAGRWEPARAAFAAALALDVPGNTSLLCQWAACEFKAGQTERAEELLRQAQGNAEDRLPAAYLMVVEAIRLRLAAPLKKRFDAEFATALAEPSAGGSTKAVALAAEFRREKITYRGQPGHQKRLLDCLARVPAASFSEDQLAAAADAMLDLDVKKARGFAVQGQRRFPKNARFPLVEADSWMLDKKKSGSAYRARDLLARARRLAEAMPAGDARDALLEEIDDHSILAGGPGSPLDMLSQMFGGMMNGGDFNPDDPW